MLLEVDPIGLARSKRQGSQAFSLAQYVNDRPYVASSFLTVAMGRVFRTAMAGRCEARPELAGAPLALEVRVPAMPSTGGADLIRQLFEPLGWTVAALGGPVDPQFPEWGASPYFDVTLSGTLPLDQALSHLSVLLPCLDGGKHYWVSADEVDKLVRTGGAWLAQHPQRELILRRSLAHQRDLVLSAVGRLAEVDDTSAALFDDAVPATCDEADSTPDVRTVSLAQQRIDAVLEALRSVGAHRVIDMGCGEGALIRRLLQDPAYTEVLGADVSPRALESASHRLSLDRMPDTVRARLRLIQSSLVYGDQRLVGFDAMVLQEVVEHVDADRLPSLERSVFAVARPSAVVVTTPNADYNVRFESLPTGTMRHHDHRFEWSRAEFAAWSERIAAQHGYRVELRPVGAVDPDVGPATQLALYTRLETAVAS